MPTTKKTPIKIVPSAAIKAEETAIETEARALRDLTRERLESVVGSRPIDATLPEKYRAAVAEIIEEERAALDILEHRNRKLMRAMKEDIAAKLSVHLDAKVPASDVSIRNGRGGREIRVAGVRLL